jgi:hypothetical protein
MTSSYLVSAWTGRSEDVLLVQINLLERHATPTTNWEIVGRLNEITFNSPLMGELRAIEFVARLIDQGATAARHRAGQSTAAFTCTGSRSRTPSSRSIGRASSTPTTIFSKCFMIGVAAQHAAS